MHGVFKEHLLHWSGKSHALTRTGSTPFTNTDVTFFTDDDCYCLTLKHGSNKFAEREFFKKMHFCLMSCYIFVW